MNVQTNKNIAEAIAYLELQRLLEELDNGLIKPEAKLNNNNIGGDEDEQYS